MGPRETELINFFKRKGGVASYAELLEAGFNKTVLKTSLDSKRIDKIDRGIYVIANGASITNPDLVAVSLKIPRGVVCLISALSFHEATKEIPRQVDIALPRGSHVNKISYPPVKFYHLDLKVWDEGIEEHKIKGYQIKVYSLAKTVADCFKFRNKIGIDIAREALKVAVNEKKVKPKEIMKYAKICRVDRLIKPIMEMML